MPPLDLHERVGRLIDEVAALHPEGAATLAVLRRAHHDHLVVALAGWMKAGKSTLLNALLGAEVAPTDAGECTRVLTSYRWGADASVLAHLVDGTARRLSVDTTGPLGAFDRALEGLDAASVVRLEVEWPAPWLRTCSLLDTPGLVSPTPGLSARTRRALHGELADVAVDAVVYLVRYLHPADLAFLEAFAAAPRAEAGPVNAVAVLARADEIGTGHGDGLADAGRVAARYRADRRLRRLVQTVLPVDARLAVGSAMLTDVDVEDLRALAALDLGIRSRLLLSAELVVRAAEPVALDPLRRAALVQRLGLSGLRLAVAVLASSPALSPPALAAVLRRASGVEDVERLIGEQFTGRARVLKARATLQRLDRLIATWPPDVAARVAGAIEAVAANAAELAELGELQRLRQDPTLLDLAHLSEADREEAERILGAHGAAPSVRLGLDTGSGSDPVRDRAAELARPWRARAESPWATVEVVRLARVVVRTLEYLAQR